MNRSVSSLVMAVALVACVETSAFAQGVEQRLADVETQLGAALESIAALEAANATLQAQVTTLSTRVDTADFDIQQLDFDIQQLQMGFSLAEQRVIDLESNSLLALDSVLDFNPTDKKVVFEGVNVQVVNGTGNTSTFSRRYPGGRR